ncbi:MAG: BatD family protein [Chitinophagaceae bacterium]
MKKVMQHISFSLWLLLLSHSGIQAQKDFKTIVTQGPVVAGESFQVQYVLEDTDKDNEFFAPDFKGFRFVSGPNIYTGSAYGKGGTRKFKNIVYTLAADLPGKFVIPGASARIENRLIKSGNVFLEVISKSDAYKPGRQPTALQTNEDNFLSPGEEPYAKIRRNLFMKVLVDKRTCFVGEPVTAVFKLYSRLDSKSDIVKNPGFYGFTVQDMINLDDRITTNETVNGKEFDVHIVRKVQLYPLQAGLYSIDAMEVRNKVSFSKSEVNKKAEQEIIEGVFPGSDSPTDDNTAVFENSMSTVPLAISVKPTPQKNKPTEYSGATGDFKLVASLQKDELARNEEGELVVTISGKGNFTQLSAPFIQWPAGIEGFEPTVSDHLDHTQSPLNGKREFHFRFVSAKPGNYELPAVGFSFFNPDTNNYKTIYTKPANVQIANLEKYFEKVEVKSSKAKEQKKHLAWWVVAGGVLASVLLFILIRREKKQQIKPVPDTGVADRRPNVAEVLQPAITFSAADDKTFYNILRNCIWNFFTEHFGLTGSKMNKSTLLVAMQQKKIDEKSRTAILSLLDQCETGIFTSAGDVADKKRLLGETKETLERISRQL